MHSFIASRRWSSAVCILVCQYFHAFNSLPIMHHPRDIVAQLSSTNYDSVIQVFSSMWQCSQEEIRKHSNVCIEARFVGPSDPDKVSGWRRNMVSANPAKVGALVDHASNLSTTSQSLCYGPCCRSPLNFRTRQACFTVTSLLP